MCKISAAVALKRDDFSSNRHLALGLLWSMIFSENRYTIFGIMLWTPVAAPPSGVTA
jgi:hypothetical protein